MLSDDGEDTEPSLFLFLQLCRRLLWEDVSGNHCPTTGFPIFEDYKDTSVVYDPEMNKVIS